MAFNMESVTKEMMAAITKKLTNLNHLNIIVAGKTGVGKSTLINAVFREQLTETGIGRPVTTHMRKIEKPGFPLSVYDTRGFELGKVVQNEVKKEILDTINQGIASKEINQMIHCIWYCINTTSNRIEPEEINWLKELTSANQAQQVPVIVVLTQAISNPNAEKMKKLLLEENLAVAQIVPVLAQDYEIDATYTKKAYGLDNLIQIMGHCLPEELMDTLQNVQIASLAEKKRHARKAIQVAALATASEGVVPIPLADSVMIVPTQISMIASITVIFGFDVNKSILGALLSSTIGASGATILGRTVSSNLLKLLPGAGSVVGGAISASTAAAITYALGEAYLLVMELVFTGKLQLTDINSKKGKKLMSEAFKQQLKLRKTK